MASSGNPKDSMKSTWRKDKSVWRRPHRILNKLDPFYTDPNNPVPVFQKDDPLPCLTAWSCNAWILSHALWPMLLQYIYTKFTGYNIHTIAATMLFTFAFKANSMHKIQIIRRLAQKYGYLDGDKHPRDEVPDAGVDKVVWSVQLTTTVRPVLMVLMAYNRYEGPGFSWWIPVELTLYSIILDLFFYAYHRSCHEIDFLWKYHRTHHLTKHPSPFLSAYADAEQEVLEIAVIPLLTYATLKLLGLPMGFYDWWICHEYIIFSEALGHSGLRLFSTTPGPSSLILKQFGCELVIEDHDLHHRKGWRKSSNYGKQTRLWDRLFGSCGERIEASAANIDYSHEVNFPLI